MILLTSWDLYLRHNVVCHVTWKQLKMLSHETVHRNRIKLVATEKTLNRQKCLITLYIRGMIKNYMDFPHNFLIDHSNAFKLSHQMPPFNMHMSAKFLNDISIHYRIIVYQKHTPLPSRSSPLTLMTMFCQSSRVSVINLFKLLSGISL